MTIGTDEFARLSNDAYNDRTQELRTGKEVDLDGIRYKVLAVAHDPKSDYQGTAYRRIDTGEVIISHRGTASVKDGLTDAAMVFAGRNNQFDRAMPFTDQAIALAKQEAQKNSQPLSVSITGHSQGGTLAEITAAKHGLHAETFNAFGPAGLTSHALQIFYAPREQQDANDYSDMLGYTTVRKQNVTRGREMGRSESEERRALMLPQELKAMEPNKEVFLHESIPHPVKCDKIKYYQDKYFTQRFLPKITAPELKL